MSSSQYTLILQKLIRRTKEDAIAWTESDNPNEFVAPFAEFGLSMKYISGGAGRDTILFSIRSKQARIIDQFAVGADLGATWDEVVELYFAARRRALSIDDAISTIINALDGDPPEISASDKESKNVDMTADGPLKNAPDEDAQGPSATLPLRQRSKTGNFLRSA
jgi:hypothetical protein